MKNIHFAVAVALACLGALLAAAPAGAAVSCSYTAGNHTMTIDLTANGDFVSIQRSGATILVDSASCGGASVTNTNKVVLNGSAGAQSVSISMFGGPFEPGFTPEGSGISEIEFEGSLLAGTDSIAIHGTTGPDTIIAGLGGFNLNTDGDADVTTGGIEQRTIFGDSGADTLSAAGGLGTGAILADRVSISGDAGNDIVTGGDGGDYLAGGDDQDSISGGNGSDWYMTGGPGPDSVGGGYGNDTMYGDPGNDTVTGGGGNDSFYAGADPDGNDTYAGGGGRDFLSYYIRGTAALDISLDGVANDGRVGSEFDNVQPDIEGVEGSKGPNVITGTAADNGLTGLGGADTISGGDGFDSLSGGDGADILTGGDDSDSLYGGNGADQLSAGPGDDNLTGGFENDTLSGGADVDSFYAESGPDGADDMSGGAGVDSLYFYSRSGNMTISLDGNNNDGLAGEMDNYRPDIENVTSGSGNDTLTGSGAPNVLNGGLGDDIMSGGAEDDVMNGGQGDDQLTGGDGQDTMDGSGGADHFHALDGGSDTVLGGLDLDTDVVNDSDPFDTIFQIP
jgi:Ca2+-binding RTX toxin-like protein